METRHPKGQRTYKRGVGALDSASFNSTMPTCNFHFPASPQAHYFELSAAPLDTSMALAHQRDDRIDDRHGAKPKPRRRFNSQAYTMSEDGVEKLIPTATGAGTGDRAYREDVGQPEHATPRQERGRRTSFDRRQHRTRASIPGLPPTATARAHANGVDQSYIPTRTAAQTFHSREQTNMDILLDEYHLMPQAERHRLRALLPPPIPLVPKEKSSKSSFLGRLNPFRRIRSLPTPPSYRAIVFIPSENSGHARRRSLARRG
ncbi:hypothetical protein OG21DRAFT_15648 [Imleria badia]|nr:hypothetical protein OG21DRAFT_15648 [Imleria badia]